jgi:thiosulfate/3-mercaptopyruvate sulfurtransferase
VRRIAGLHGLPTEQPTISFCNTGHWAATNWFVLSEVLGQKDVKLYPESVVAWSHAGLAMDNVPGRLAQFWLQLKEATGNL